MVVLKQNLKKDHALVITQHPTPTDGFKVAIEDIEEGTVIATFDPRFKKTSYTTDTDNGDYIIKREGYEVVVYHNDGVQPQHPKNLALWIVFGESEDDNV